VIQGISYVEFGFLSRFWARCGGVVAEYGSVQKINTFSVISKHLTNTHIHGPFLLENSIFALGRKKNEKTKQNEEKRE
jgi:hypothetical protein